MLKILVGGLGPTPTPTTTTTTTTTEARTFALNPLAEIQALGCRLQLWGLRTTIPTLLQLGLDILALITQISRNKHNRNPKLQT